MFFFKVLRPFTLQERVLPASSRLALKQHPEGAEHNTKHPSRATLTGLCTGGRNG